MSSTSVTIGEPHLFEGEAPLMHTAMKGITRYQEFGMGGSTLLAVKKGIRHIVAIDTSPEWVKTARSHPDIAPKVAAGHVVLLHGDIGPVERWGRPAPGGDKQSWPRYLADPWREWERMRRLPELVYVDGRFRVACALITALVIGASPAASKRLRVLMHDMDGKRPYYDAVLEFFEVVEKVNTLCLMRLKPRNRVINLVPALLEAQFDPR